MEFFGKGGGPDFLQKVAKAPKETKAMPIAMWASRAGRQEFSFPNPPKRVES